MVDYVEFRRHLGKAGLTVNSFAELLHIQPSSVSNYSKKGRVPQAHAIIAVALGDAGDRGADLRDLLAKYRVFSATGERQRRKVTSIASFRNRPTRKK